MQPDMGSIPFCQFQFQFQFHSIPFGQFQFHIKFVNSNSKSSNSNSIPPNIFVIFVIFPLYSQTVQHVFTRVGRFLPYRVKNMVITQFLPIWQKYFLGGNFHKNTQLIEIILNKQLTTQINIQQRYLIINLFKKTSPEHATYLLKVNVNKKCYHLRTCKAKKGNVFYIDLGIVTP